MENFGCRDLKVTVLPIPHLIRRPGNARTHSKAQIRQIASSLRAFGFTNPILVDDTGVIVAGHGRLEAAKLLGMNEVPTICLDGLNADQIRAYVLADNRLAEKAGWDKSILAIELQHLLTIDCDFDITVTGFEIPEIDLLLASDGDVTDDDFGHDHDQHAVTQPGDLWMLGKHRILCGNALEEISYSQLLETKSAAVVFTDPPYNVRIDGHAGGKGAIQHREFPMASGEMTGAEFGVFLTSSLQFLAKYSLPGSVHFVCMDWRHMGELLEAGGRVYDSLLNVCVWVKNAGGMGSLYRSRHEMVFVFRHGEKGHRNNVQLGRYGRNRTNVWEYGSINTSKNGEEGNLLALHPTVKPVALIADALLDCSARGDVVLDVFLGSGSTLMAAQRTGRACYGIELDPLYVDTAIRRWQRYTGDRAIHALSRRQFEEIADERLEAVRG